MSFTAYLRDSPPCNGERGVTAKGTNMTNPRNLLAAATLAAAAVIPGTGIAAGQGYTEAVYSLTFASAAATFTFLIEKAQGAGQLVVDTRDCCISGDKWKVVVDPSLPRAANKDATGVGSGSTVLFSGSAATIPFVTGGVVVSHDSGVNVYPAGMTIRFAYMKGTGMNIVAPAGAVLVSSAP